MDDDQLTQKDIQRLVRNKRERISQLSTDQIKEELVITYEQILRLDAQKQKQIAHKWGIDK